METKEKTLADGTQLPGSVIMILSWGQRATSPLMAQIWLQDFLAAEEDFARAVIRCVRQYSGFHDVLPVLYGWITQTCR